MLRKKEELMKKRYDNYVWTATIRRNPEKITDIHIHPKSTPVAITVYRDNDIRNFKYNKEFKFGNFILSEWDELGSIFPTKSNKCMGDLMNSLSKKFEGLKRISNSLEINKSLLLPEQDPLLPSNRKRKAMELKPETYIVGLHCNCTLLKGVSFMNNKVTEEPEHGLFFTDVFGDPSF
ncbi:hypothetical protein Tco_0939192 [Tanacetum coccineum]|uniref:Uncharacterized protein n=1 Tax=Tanacetum coccineum TaxID=301880 RepID=A0ABQ5DJW9_9ASTR